MYLFPVSENGKGRSGVDEKDASLCFNMERVRRHGHSIIVTLHAPLRKMLGVQVGDHLAFRKLGRYVVISVIRPYQIVQFSEEEKRKAVESVGV